jgi:hypothetical protein
MARPNFFSVGIISIFSTLLGIIINALLNDFGALPAIAFYVVSFLADYYSTIKIKDCHSKETNPLFAILQRKFSPQPSFFVIFLVGILINIVSFLAIGDTVMSYVIGTGHVCMAITNHSISKYKEEKCT